MKPAEISQLLAEKGLKVTPQRMAVIGALNKLKNHPTTEMVIEFIKRNHPNISAGTVYKTLEILTENNIIRKVKTEKDVMRYDAILVSHHHLYCADSDRIEDYFDEDLDEILQQYFLKKDMPDFEIEDIKLHIKGKFKSKKSKN
jgi:Fur family peroxide stress response transcriptional regulator